MHGASRKRLRRTSPSPPSPPPPLPIDIIFSIFLMLPIKSLFRCRLVCKNWDSIIRSRTFVLTYNVSRPHRYLFANIKESRGVECKIFDENSFSLLASWTIPSTFCDPSQIPLLIGSCNGLLLISSITNFGRRLYLWNPSIRKHKCLTTSCLFNGKFTGRFQERSTTVVGFGFDSKTNDFKILRMVYFWSRHRLRNNRRRPEAEIYSLSSDSWRRLVVPYHIANGFGSLSPLHYVCVHGCIHWIARFIDEHGRPYDSILGFDVSEERFIEVNLPNDYNDGIARMSHHLTVFKGLLTFNVNGYEDDDVRVCTIWSKKENFWIKKSLRFGSIPEFCWCYGVEDYLIIKINSTEILVIDLHTRVKKALQIPCLSSIHTFTETLALL